MKQISAVALSVMSMTAWATCPSGSCSTTVYTDVTTLPALNLTLDTSANADGSWNYTYRLSRSSSESTPFYIKQLLLPYFGDAGITNLQVGSAQSGYMSVSIQDKPNDISTKSIVDYTSFIPPKSLPIDAAEFRFTSIYAPTVTANAQVFLDGTYSESTSYSSGYMVTSVVRGIAPATPMLMSIAIPGSPTAISAVPEADTAILFATGFGLLGLLASRRKRTADQLKANSA